MNFKHGYYKFMGNTVEYWGGQFAQDIDARKNIPVLALAHAKYIGEEL